MKVLVTGATGGCGKLVVHRLLDLGIAVRVLTRDARQATDLKATEVVEGNALTPADCVRAVTGCNAVICTLGDRAVPADGRIVDGEGIINLASAAVHAEAPRFVLVSSLGVGDSWVWLPFPVRWAFQWSGTVPILKAKERSEDWVRASPLRWTILRPGLLTNFRMRAEPMVLPTQTMAPGITTRQAVADVAVRSLTSENTVGQVFTVVNRMVRWAVRTKPIVLDVPWVPWSVR